MDHDYLPIAKQVTQYYHGKDIANLKGEKDMKIVHTSVKGSNSWNEDALIIHNKEQVYGVIDGATSLIPFTGTNGETGGYLASRIIANTLDRIMSQQEHETIPLTEALMVANRELRMEMLNYDIDLKHKEVLWSACAAIIRINEYSIEFAQVGDCMIIAVYADGLIRVITRDQLAHVDQETYRLWAEGLAEGLTSRQELWDHVKAQIVKGRQLTNTPSGYAVLNGEPEVADYMESGRINRINLKAILLMTDGLYLPKRANEKLFDAMEVTKLVMKQGLEPYISGVIELEENDPECHIYPRVKTSDDKTAIWIEL